mmetsp:Transcript_24915/g.77571  ORF Transcript_24915/g.77571 Transcript_24915/m.77571 type:complete len:261 (+) Transcript_24915:92-874(+)
MGKKGDAAENARRKAEKRMQKQQRNQQESASSSANLRTTLKKLGLRVRPIEPDGNCQFRAVADQLFGDQSRYRQVRNMAIAELEGNPEIYSNFITDDEKFADYCHRMRDEAEWGDMTTLMALAGAGSLRVIVHQNDTELPRYELVPQKGEVRRTIHVLFDPSGEHYESIRALGDDDDGPPARIPWPGTENEGTGDGGSYVDDLGDEMSHGLDLRGNKSSAREKRAPKAGTARSKKRLQEEMKAQALNEARKEELSKTLTI